MFAFAKAVRKLDAFVQVSAIDLNREFRAAILIKRVSVSFYVTLSCLHSFFVPVGAAITGFSAAFIWLQPQATLSDETLKTLQIVMAVTSVVVAILSAANPKIQFSSRSRLARTKYREIKSCRSRFNRAFHSMESEPVEEALKIVSAFQRELYEIQESEEGGNNERFR